MIYTYLLVIFSIIIENNCGLRPGVYQMVDNSHWRLSIPKKSNNEYFTLTCIDYQCELDYTFQYEDCNNDEDVVELCSYDGTGNFIVRFSNCSKFQSKYFFDKIEFLERGIVSNIGEFYRN